VEVMGALGDFDVAGILHLLGMRRATGRVAIVADGDEVSLYLQGGRLALVSSVRLPLRLGRVLQQRGLLSARRLHEALREQAADARHRSLGTILIERGWITAADIAACVEEQCIVVLSRVIAAKQGRFVYTPGVAIPAAIAPTPLDADRILLEAARRVDELQTLRAQIPSRHAPLAPSARIEVTIAPLTETEGKVIAALQAGAGSYEELADLLPIDERTLLRTVIGMRQRGLIVAGYGAPGSEMGMPSAPPPSEDDIARLFAETATPFLPSAIA
jgi:hypothetical protein